MWISEYEAGFRRVTGTGDHTFIMKEVETRCHEYRIVPVIFFIDFRRDVTQL